MSFNVTRAKQKTGGTGHVRNTNVYGLHVGCYCQVIPRLQTYITPCVCTTVSFLYDNCDNTSQQKRNDEDNTFLFNYAVVPRNYRSHRPTQRVYFYVYSFLLTAIFPHFLLYRLYAYTVHTLSTGC